MTGSGKTLAFVIPVVEILLMRYGNQPDHYSVLIYTTLWSGNDFSTSYLENRTGRRRKYACSQHCQYTHTHTHTRTHAHTHSHKHMRTHSCIHTRTHTHTRTHARTHKHMRTHSCTHTRTHTDWCHHSVPHARAGRTDWSCAEALFTGDTLLVSPHWGTGRQC